MKQTYAARVPIANSVCLGLSVGCAAAIGMGCTVGGGVLFPTAKIGVFRRDRQWTCGPNGTSKTERRYHVFGYTLIGFGLLLQGLLLAALKSPLRRISVSLPTFTPERTLSYVLDIPR